ncbi:MAG: hypothetical protein HY319_30620 [Armatimonadetes bacterium]|nr:hypothetical protein [Armatimonadota bacterium]
MAGGPGEEDLAELVRLADTMMVMAVVQAADAGDALRRLSARVPLSNLQLVVAGARVKKLCRLCGGNGCGPCRMAGFQGQTSLYELLPWTGAVARALKEGGDLSAFLVSSFAEQASLLLQEGTTTAAELSRVGIAVPAVRPA